MVINKIKSLKFKINKILLFLIFVLLLSSPAHTADKIIGVVMTGDILYYKAVHKAFLDGLSAHGLSGKYEVVLQTPAPDATSWSNAARKLVAIDSSIIVTYGGPATLAVMAEASKIPVVYAGVYDPQALGITGKNITGISSKVPMASIIKNLKSITNFSTLGVVYSDSEKDTLKQVDEVKNLEGQSGFKSVKFNLKKAGDASKITKVDALLVTTSCNANQCIDDVMGIAHREKIPTVANISGVEEKGAILTISSDPVEQGRTAAEIVTKILGGAKPDSIPPSPPKKIDMIINLKEATSLGLKIPFDILTSATKVIK